MTPAAIAAIISLVEEAISVEPEVAASIKNIFSTGADIPTIITQLQALRTQVAMNNYSTYVPQTTVTGE